MLSQSEINTTTEAEEEEGEEQEDDALWSCNVMYVSINITPGQARGPEGWTRGDTYLN